MTEISYASLYVTATKNTVELIMYGMPKRKKFKNDLRFGNNVF